ncbi:Uncharacterized protein TCM_011115 [Theobroma cacao]|uniref:Uncharacterized protein n=1 Tax=Theobroma cacao TaxID=3641 RepID=A0A061EFZ5_THECC|nr:Uncharacterized protein TCM_011115 [Theobroma cacao]
MIIYGDHYLNNTYKGGETRERGSVESDLLFLGLMKLVEEVVGVNLQNHKIKLHALFNHAIGVLRVIIRGDEDVNDEMDDDCEDDYVGERDDCLMGDINGDNDILDCNHADGSTEHARTVVLEAVQCDDHAITILLEDVEYDDPIYDNPITGENGNRSSNDSYQERVNTGVSHQWIILGVDMIYFQTVAIEESRSIDNHL